MCEPGAAFGRPLAFLRDALSCAPCPAPLPSQVRPMPWLQVRLAITPDQAATYEDALLETGAVSVTFMDAEDQPIFEPDLGTTPLWNKTHLLALFEGDTDADQVITQLRLSTGEPLPEHQIERIEDQDWERSWMDNFQPMRFGARLWIVPSWHAAPEPDAVNLLLDPGLAFGTGTHPTTSLCLQWLDAQELGGTRLVDFGCGSGILGIAALLLGAGVVLGIDNDPQALTATVDNCHKNRLDPARFPLYLPQAFTRLQTAADFVAVDGVMANILAGTLIELAPQLAVLVRPSGWLLLSGILRGQSDAVCVAFTPWFRDFEVASEGDWVRISALRKAP